MAVFERKSEIEITSQELYDFLTINLNDFYFDYLGLCDEDVYVIDNDVVLKELAEYILNKEREVE